MAEVTAMRNNALPYPVYGVPWTVVFPILDADGDTVTGASALDSEVSKNGDTFADCTNEATEIATSSGNYYLTLTGAEMTADVVMVQVKTSTSGAKTTVLTFYPRKLVALRAGTCQGGAAGYMTLDASAGAADDLWNGCLVVGVLDTLTEARIITDYTGSSQQAAVTPNWNNAPDNDDTFTIYLPEGRQIPQANTTHLSGTAQTARDIGTSVLLSSGTGTGQLNFTSGVVQADAAKVGGQTASASGTVTFPNATLASTTNITAGTITTVTNLTNAPTAGDLTVTMKTSVTTACTASTPTAAAVTGAVGSVTGNVGGNVVGSVASVSGAVGSVTGNVGGNVTGSVGSVTGAVGSVTGNVGGNVAGSVGSLATQAKADVNAEVVDCLNVDTYAEVGQEAPAATQTIRKMLAILYKAWRNKKTQTSSTFSLYADDASTVDQKATVSDDATTTTIGEIASGP